MMRYEALEKSMARDNYDQLLSDLAEVRKEKKKRQGSPKTPSRSLPHPLPPPPPPAGPSGTSGASGASGSSQSPPPPPPPSNNQGGQSSSTAAPSSLKTATSAWTTTDTRIKLFVSPIPEELHMDDDTTADEQAYSSISEDVRRDHIPTVNLRQSWWKPLTKDRPATPKPAWYNVSEPLPLGSDPGHVTIQPDFFFNKDLEYLWYSRKMGRHALSISKIKAAYYPNVGLEQMDGKVRYSIPRSHQSWRDLPKDNPLVSVEVLSTHSEDGNPARANIKQALGLHKDGDADASFHFHNSDKYYHDPEECEYAGPRVTTSQEGNISQQGRLRDL
ncbi:hypothetical protein Tco_0404923 [Tanacetum coccineum]